ENLGDDNAQRCRWRDRNRESLRAWPRNTCSRRERTSTHTKAGFGPIESGDVARVRRFQPVDRLNNRISGSVVCHLADKLGMCAARTLMEKKMSKVIEADFFPRESNLEFSWRGSTASSTAKEKRRILIVDNDRDSTHLVKILLEKTGWYSVLEENEATRAHLRAQNFMTDLI